jgi:hypothetical protein
MKTNRIKNIVEKQIQPKYSALPNFLKLLPESKQSFRILLPKIIFNGFDPNLLDFYCYFFYIKKNDFLKLKEKLGIDIDSSIINISSEPINIKLSVKNQVQEFRVSDIKLGKYENLFYQYLDNLISVKCVSKK